MKRRDFIATAVAAGFSGAPRARAAPAGQDNGQGHRMSGYVDGEVA